MRPILSILLAATVAGCFTSRPVSRTGGRAQAAEGVGATIMLAGGQEVRGELLVIDSASVTVLASQGIVVVPHTAVREARFAGYPRITVEQGVYNAQKVVWDRIVLEARYPYGIPEPALGAIMQSRQQARVDTLRVP